MTAPHVTIRGLRRAAKMDCAELYEKAGISRMTLWRAENREVSVDVLDKIATALGVPVQMLAEYRNIRASER